MSSTPKASSKTKSHPKGNPLSKDTISGNNKSPIHGKSNKTGPPTSNKDSTGKSEEDDDLPMPPKTLRQLGLPFPKFPLPVGPNGPPSQVFLEKFRKRCCEALDAGQELPLPPPEFNPFLIAAQELDAAMEEEQ